MRCRLSKRVSKAFGLYMEFRRVCWLPPRHPGSVSGWPFVSRERLGDRASVQTELVGNSIVSVSQDTESVGGTGNGQCQQQNPSGN